MLKFYPATVVRKTAATSDSVVITLAVPENVADEFRYSHGQHLPVRAQIDGKSERRTYSICASVAEQTLRIGVRVQGAFSKYIADQLNIGDTLEVMPPTGHFQTRLAGNQSKAYAAFVSGSGITPILSIVKTTLETEPDSRFVIFYGNRKRSTTMFIEELWNLKNCYPERLALHFVMSREKAEIEIYTGRIDGQKVKALHEAFLQGSRPDDVFICGPNPMIDDVSGSLVALGYARDRIHTERFRAEQVAETTVAETQLQRDHGIAVTIIMDGNRQSFQMRDAKQTLLEAAEEKGLDLPYACKSGVCSTCRTMLSKGKVSMTSNNALEDWELEEGFILACQSHPETDEIELDYDQA